MWTVSPLLEHSIWYRGVMLTFRIFLNMVVGQYNSSSHVEVMTSTSLVIFKLINSSYISFAKISSSLLFFCKLIRFVTSELFPYFGSRSLSEFLSQRSLDNPRRTNGTVSRFHLNSFQKSTWSFASIPLREPWWRPVWRPSIQTPHLNSLWITMATPLNSHWSSLFETKFLVFPLLTIRMSLGMHLKALRTI